MGNDYINLFEMLGIEPENPPKKEEKKSTSEKKSKTKKADIISLPVIVYTGYYNPVHISEKDFGKSEVTQSEVHEFLANMFPDYPTDISVLEKGNNVLYLIHKDIYKVAKGVIEIKPGAKIIFAGETIDLINNEGDVKTEDLENIFKERFGFGKMSFIYSNKNNIIVPVFDSPLFTDEIDFPVKIAIGGRSVFTVDKDDVKSLSSQLDEGENGINTKKMKANKGLLAAIIAERYPEFDADHLELQINEDNKLVIAKMIEKNSYRRPEPEKYPTNATLSLVYVSFKLSPDMFGGKEKVDGEELRKFVAKDRPEYSSERTIIEYDEKNNLIIMMVKSSSKGAELIADDKKALELISSEDYALFDWFKNEDGVVYRVEKSKELCVIASKDSKKADGYFTLLTPKVPYSLHETAVLFFQIIFNMYKTEAMLQLFFDRDKLKYFWHLPVQRVMPDRCIAERDYSMESKYSLIGDFHSHGFYDAFFSRYDDEDELGFRIYGVYGPFNTLAGPSLKLRAGTGGYFVNDVSFDDVFSSSKSDNEDDSMIISLLKDIPNKVIV